MSQFELNVPPRWAAAILCLLIGGIAHDAEIPSLWFGDLGRVEHAEITVSGNIKSFVAKTAGDVKYVLVFNRLCSNVTFRDSSTQRVSGEPAAGVGNAQVIPRPGNAAVLSIAYFCERVRIFLFGKDEAIDRIREIHSRLTPGINIGNVHYQIRIRSRRGAGSALYSNPSPRICDKGFSRSVVALSQLPKLPVKTCCLVSEGSNCLVGLRRAGLNFLQSFVGNPDSAETGGGKNQSEKGHPDACTSGFSSRAICGAFILFLGAAFLKIAFYIADEPQSPMVTRLTYFVVGTISACFIIQDTILVTPIYCLLL